MENISKENLLKLKEELSIKKASYAIAVAINEGFEIGFLMSTINSMIKGEDKMVTAIKFGAVAGLECIKVSHIQKYGEYAGKLQLCKLALENKLSETLVPKEEKVYKKGL